MNRRRFLVGVVCAAAVCRLAAQEAPRPSAVRAITVPSQDIEVVSQVGGVIRRILVQEGDRVEKGQILVELDAEVQKAVLAIGERKARSTARVEAAEANLRVKRATYARQEMLHRRGVASDADLEQAELELRHAEALLTVSKEEQAVQRLEVERDRRALERLTIRAPMAGIVLRRLRDVGEAAEEYEPVLRLVVLDVLHVVAYVAPELAARLRPGGAARLALDTAPDRKLPCAILMVDPLVDAASGTCRVQLELANRDGSVIAGSKGTLDFGLRPDALPPDRRP
jgi:RND family efflux transporter MFP subunit